MRICIVGGIFDKPAAYRERHSISPETVLADGLRQRGWEVSVRGHSAAPPLAGFDFVHVHHFGRAALRLAMDGRMPFVITTHDPFAMNGLAVGFRRRLTDGYVLRRAAAVVALSHAERAFLSHRYHVGGERIAVIPNGIRVEVFNGSGEQSNHELLFVGQLQAFKGLGYLLEALVAIRGSHPLVRLTVVYQTGALLERYQAQVARLGLDGCVNFAGAKSAVDLARLYSTAAVVVSPSLGECLSTVVLEAMSCGAAVVATDVGGIREQIGSLYRSSRAAAGHGGTGAGHRRAAGESGAAPADGAGRQGKNSDTVQRWEDD
jgi:glycosyltransferase involved in cell wall biosynthesis